MTCRRGKELQKHYSVFVARLLKPQQEFVPQLTEDHSSFRWFPIAEAAKLEGLHPVLENVFTDPSRSVYFGPTCCSVWSGWSCVLSILTSCMCPQSLRLIRGGRNAAALESNITSCETLICPYAPAFRCRIAHPKFCLLPWCRKQLAAAMNLDLEVVASGKRPKKLGAGLFFVSGGEALLLTRNSSHNNATLSVPGATSIGHQSTA